MLVTRIAERGILFCMNLESENSSKIDALGPVGVILRTGGDGEGVPPRLPLWQVRVILFSLRRGNAGRVTVVFPRAEKHACGPSVKSRVAGFHRRPGVRGILGFKVSGGTDHLSNDRYSPHAILHGQ